MIRVIVISLLLSACQTIPNSIPMQLGAPIPEHDGYKDFCMREPTECMLPAEKAVMKSIRQTNYLVNDSVSYKSDTGDMWQLTSLNSGKGDCEDYALQKRHLLREKFPEYAPAFRIATLWTETGGYHAVLAVTTTAGVYVLDNRFPDIAPWKSLPYHWHMMEQPGKKDWVLISG